jgi:hypothetical protein
MSSRSDPEPEGEPTDAAPASTTSRVQAGPTTSSRALRKRRSKDYQAQRQVPRALLCRSRSAPEILCLELPLGPGISTGRWDQAAAAAAAAGTSAAAYYSVKSLGRLVEQVGGVGSGELRTALAQPNPIDAISRVLAHASSLAHRQMRVVHARARVEEARAKVVEAQIAEAREKVIAARTRLREVRLMKGVEAELEVVAGEMAATCPASPLALLPEARRGRGRVALPHARDGGGGGLTPQLHHQQLSEEDEYDSDGSSPPASEDGPVPKETPASWATPPHSAPSEGVPPERARPTMQQLTNGSIVGVDTEDGCVIKLSPRDAVVLTGFSLSYATSLFASQA